MTTLPTELICAIAESLVSERRAEPPQFDNSCSVKQRWGAIGALSTASKLFRAIALEAWFQRLYLSSEDELNYLTHHWPAVFDWVREIHFVIAGASEAWSLRRFARVRRIRIDLLDTASYGFPFTDVPASLAHLNIRNINWPSPGVYATIATTFRHIQTLHIHQPRVWCGLCNVCEIPNFEAARTESVRYAGGGGLPAHYAIALAPMQRLARVQLTVGNLGRAKRPLNARENADAWAGECSSCMRSLYRDEAFRASWVAKKTSAPPEAGGEGGADPHPHGAGKEQWDVLRRPPLLRDVVWEFWGVDKDDLDSHEGMENGM
ncbi:hypothetical protein FIBSPDRAFT_960464 [Athelia psychrophila]|uniref:F-box domain-containing protein n=1 Tax=Athelia psychrophila TaxID=1759441 RepID=A0A166CDI1_9AGAM|nr:hypothetical protein FIBSPDRAFT_960464 [Fibularhizoctonia sp. CBS 109695]